MSGTKNRPYCSRKLRKPLRINIKKCIRTIAIIAIIGTVVFFCLHCYLYRQWQLEMYDLKTASYENTSSDLETLYLYTPYGSIDELAASIILLPDDYFRTFSINNYYYVAEHGIYEREGSTLYVQDEEGGISEYLIMGDYLVEKDSFYSGEIPKKDTFDSVNIRNGIKVIFSSDGTYIIKVHDTQYKGTYVRDGYDIICTCDDNIEGSTKFLIYDGKLTENYYHAPIVRDADADWIIYKTYLYMRDVLKRELGYAETAFILRYEDKYPISANK